MLRIKKVRCLAIAAGQLAQYIGRIAARRLAIAEAFAPNRARKLVSDDIVIQLRRIAQGRAVDAGELPRLRLAARQIARDPGGGSVAQLAPQRRALPGVEAKPGGLLGRIRQPFVEETIEHGAQPGIGRSGLGKGGGGGGRQRGRAAGGKELASVHDRKLRLSGEGR